MITTFLLTALIAAPAAVLAAAPAPAPAAATATASTAAVNAAVPAANERFAARCAREPMSVDELLSDPVFRADMAYAAGEERLDLLEFASCRALQGAPTACAQLEAPGRRATGDAVRCQLTVAEDRFAMLAVRGGDALPACRSMLAFDGRTGPDVDKDCAAMTSLVRSAGSAMTCEQIKRAKIGPPESCEDTRVFWSAEAKDCDQYFKNPSAQRVCRARAALVAGLRVPAQCAGSPYCQALTTRSPAACEPLRAKFARGLCARVANDLADAKRRLTQEQELRAAQAKEKAAAQAAAAAKAGAAAQAAAAAEVRAKTEAALARSKAEQLAAEEKVRKNAEVQAAKKAAVDAAVKAKAEVEARKAAEAKAKVERAAKPQFQKGEVMQKDPPEIKEMLKAIEEGRPIPKPKPAPKPKKAVPQEETPSEQ